MLAANPMAEVSQLSWRAVQIPRPSLPHSRQFLQLSTKAHTPFTTVLPIDQYRSFTRTVSKMCHGRKASYAGLVICRQRPGTASGVIFITLEDETATVNVIVRRDVLAQFRVAVLSARLLRVVGVMQRAGAVTHCLAHEIVDESARLGSLKTRSRAPRTSSRRCWTRAIISTISAMTACSP